MKTWEMIKELTENPEKKFMSTTEEYSALIAVVKDRCFEFQEGTSNKIKLRIITEREWEEVKEPVSFMELLQEVKMDHNLTFRYESFPEINFSFKGKLYKFLCQIGSEFASVDVARLLTEGRFYIED